jgi:hypothetical protein
MKDWGWKTKNTDDPEIIDEWLRQYPLANWALVPVRAFVMDVDCKEGSKGRESVESIGSLTPTFAVRTPSGGTHHYYAPDLELPFVTKNKWLPGVDIRYGDSGYVVLPWSMLKSGRYEIEVDLDHLDSAASQQKPPASILPSIPAWIKAKALLESDDVTFEYSTNSKPCSVPTSDKEWAEIRDRVRFMFFKNRKNGTIWNHFPLEGMKDQSQSGIRVAIGYPDDECRSQG